MENRPGKPLFSIITITFNAERQLPATMSSVAEQNFHNFEHILIDGASTDNTIAVARKLATENLRIISEPDKGLYDAMNKGIKMAKGKYLIFLNAGDSFHSKNTLYLYAEAGEKNADIIYGDTVIVDMQRNILGPRHLQAPEKLTFSSFKKGMLICHQAFAVKREIAPFYDLRYRFSSDYDWTLNCIKRADLKKVINLNTVTIDYLSDGLTDKNRTKSLKERFRIMSKNYGLFPTLFRHFGFLKRFLYGK